MQKDSRLQFSHTNWSCVDRLPLEIGGVYLHMQLAYLLDARSFSVGAPAHGLNCNGVFAQLLVLSTLLFSCYFTDTCKAHALRDQCHLVSRIQKGTQLHVPRANCLFRLPLALVLYHAWLENSTQRVAAAVSLLGLWKSREPCILQLMHVAVPVPVLTHRG